MKNIYTIYEGLLAGQEETLKGGDELLNKAKKELSTIKTYVDYSNHSLWQSSKWGWRGKRYSEGFDVKSLATVLGYWNKIDAMRITITKYNETNHWEIKITFYNSDFRTASSDSKNWVGALVMCPFSTVKTFPALLKTYIAPIFESVESIKKFMNENKADVTL